jgi:hypothetical protein
MSETFVVKHYSFDERPSLKGNGFDGLQIGEDREEAEAFVNFVNERMAEIERLRLTLSMVRPYVYGLDNIKRIDAALSGAQAEQEEK